jgi:hypothetical protein
MTAAFGLPNVDDGMMVGEEPEKLLRSDERRSRPTCLRARHRDIPSRISYHGACYFPTAVTFF